MKWLDVTALARAHLHALGPTETLVVVHYFTAYAEHFARDKPERLSRHKAYVRALTATRVHVHLGHFKPKHICLMHSKTTNAAGRRKPPT